MKHTYRITLIVSSVLTVAMALAYVYGHLFIKSSLVDLADLRSRVITEQAYTSIDQDLVSTHKETADERARVASYFVTEADTVSFIEAIESLGARTGADVTIESIEAASDATDARIHAKVEARGSWAAVMRTLIMAETLPYASSVTNVRLDISGSAGSSSRERWRGLFVVEAITAQGE